MVLRVLIIFLAFSAYGQELKTITPEQFIANNPSKEAKIIIDSLLHQFDGRSVSQAQLDDLWNDNKARNELMMARFQIINQQLYVDTFDLNWFSEDFYDAGYNYFFILFRYLQKFLLNNKINDVDFIVYMRETIPTNNPLSKKTLNIPSFLMFKDVSALYEKDKFLLPDPLFLKKDWQKLLDSIAETNKKFYWQEKIDKAFWRGATTGDFIE